MSELKVNKISPRSGTAVTLGDSGDTFTIPSGATLAIAGTVTGFTSAGIDDNATSVAITISSAEDVTFTEDILLGDSKKALFGAGSDLQIYHDGSNSYVDDTGTGRLFLRGNDRVQIQKYTGEDMISCLADGAVNIYHNNAKKFETTATGATVTGNITATGNLTSLGIDDNADATAITINSSEQVILHGGQVQSNNNTSSITYSGGSNSNAGANLTLFGGSHSSTPNVARFRVGSTEAMRINADGRLLVGKTDTARTTVGSEIRGDGFIRGTKSGGHSFDAVRTSNQGDAIRIYSENTLVGVLGTEKWGIGTSAPSEALHVVGTVRATTGVTVVSSGTEANLRLQNSTTGGGATDGLLIQATGNDVYINNYENADMYFRTNNTDRLKIENDGKIGIGTTAPQNKLHVTKNVLSGASYRANAPLIIENNSDTEVQILSGNSGSGQLRFGDGGGNFRGAISYNHSDDSFTIATNGANQVVIHSNGVISASDGIALGVGLLNTASNVLDDYEEGTFTPLFISGGGGTASGYGTQTGRYTKIGRLVYIALRVTLSNKSGLNSGGVSVGGLPFSSNSGNAGRLGVVSGDIGNISSFGLGDMGGTFLGPGGTAISPMDNSQNSVTVSDLNNNSTIDFQMTYETS